VVERHLRDHTSPRSDEGHGGAVTLIQRFGSAASLNIHLPQGPPDQEKPATEAAAAAECKVETVQVRPHRISWVRLLKRVFGIDMHHWPNCGAGKLKIIAANLERPVIEKILTQSAPATGSSRARQRTHQLALRRGRKKSAWRKVGSRIHVCNGTDMNIARAFPGFSSRYCRFTDMKRRSFSRGDSMPCMPSAIRAHRSAGHPLMNSNSRCYLSPKYL
jgi:hypothetical protein